MGCLARGGVGGAAKAIPGNMATSPKNKWADGIATTVVRGSGANCPELAPFKDPASDLLQMSGRLQTTCATNLNPDDKKIAAAQCYLTEEILTLRCAKVEEAVSRIMSEISSDRRDKRRSDIWASLTMQAAEQGACTSKHAIVAYFQATLRLTHKGTIKAIIGADMLRRGPRTSTLAGMNDPTQAMIEFARSRYTEHSLASVETADLVKKIKRKETEVLSNCADRLSRLEERSLLFLRQYEADSDSGW